MPELPEVEIYRHNIIAWLGDDTIHHAKIHDSMLVATNNSAVLEHAVSGLTAAVLTRIGKFLIWPNDRGDVLVTHLRMTGKWVPRKNNEPLRFIRAELFARDAEALAFVDARRLGQWWWGSHDDVLQQSGVAFFGPDLLDPTLTPSLLYERLRASRRPIKQTLMDQRLLAGVGNIIASEGCFRAGIHPASVAGGLSVRDVATLLTELRAHCDAVISSNMGTPVTYQGEVGAENPFLVYGREHQPCPRCHQPIHRTVLGGRSTYFCPQCQRLNK